MCAEARQLLLFQSFKEIESDQQNADGNQGKVEGCLAAKFSKNIAGDDGTSGATQGGKNDD